MSIRSTIEPVFWATVEKQAQERGQILTPFSRSVAQSVLDGGLLAYEDRLAGRRQYQVISAPTGSGKSSYAWAFVAALIEVVPDSSALVLCETIAQCEDTYKELARLMNPADLAIWTSAHDLRKEVETIKYKHGFEPSARFLAEDLPAHRVAVVTHAFYKGSRGDLARIYEGGLRTLTIVDERLQEVSVFDIDLGDVEKAKDWAARRFGSDSPAVQALKALHAYLDQVWGMERSSQKNYRALEWPVPSWLTSEEAVIAASEEPDGVQEKVIGFARSLAVGYAFMSRFEGSRQGGRFVGYRLDLPIYPGTVLLDATADIDRVSQLVPWRAPVPSPQVSFENLTVTHLAPPREIIKPRERISEVVKKQRRAEAYADWIRRTIVANTEHGEKVLAVVHKTLLDDGPLPNRDSLDEDAFDLEGRKVAFINWGYGIGSNRWKAATSVFLFGEFHKPKRVIVGEALGLLDQPAGAPKLDRMQSPNCQDEVFLMLQHGHLLRWEKQLAMRGNARNITAEGVCGRQKLFVTSEFERFLLYRERLFPGATFVVDQSVQSKKGERGGGRALAALLLSWEGEHLTGSEVQEKTGVSLKRHWARLRSDPVVQKAMSEGGWQYVSGRGPGNQSRFERVAQPQAGNDNRQPDPAQAA